MDRKYKNFVRLILSIILISGCSQTNEFISPTETSLVTAPTSSPTETSLVISSTTLSTKTIFPTKISLPIQSEQWQTYRNNNYKFSIMYPSDWIIQSENYQFLILAPQKEISWQPATPADIPKNPAIRIDFGEYIRERMGPAYFPEAIDSIILKTWIEQRVNNHQADYFSEKSIDSFVAYEVTELGLSGCDRILYWRPTDLNSLVKVSTGCESIYLDMFAQIVNSVQQIR